MRNDARTTARLQHELDAMLTVIVQLAQDAAQTYKQVMGVDNVTGWERLREFDDIANAAEALAEALHTEQREG